MVNFLTLNGSIRSDLGSANTNRLRKQGFIPAVIYRSNNDGENIYISIPKKDFDKEYLKGGIQIRPIELNIDGKSGLEIILGAWCEHYDSFQGVYKTKLCTIALSKLFTSGDQNLQFVMVQGDLIMSENKGIMTRSKSKTAKQYNQLPFYVKAVKLLTNEYQRSSQEEESYVEGYDEEEDTWEESVGEEGDFKYLSEIVDYGYIEDDGGYEEEDEDIKNDPIYQIKINEYLQDFFRKCANENTNNFMGICEQYLNDSEKKIIEGALKA